MHKHILRRLRHIAAGLLLAHLCGVGLAVSPAFAADIRVSDAWVRGTVAGQKSSAAYMNITVTSDTRIVGASTPRAERVELQEMVAEGERELRKRHRVDFIAVTPGRPFRLTPIENHLLLVNLTKPLVDNERIPLTLVFEQGGQRSELKVEAVVRPFYAGKR